MKIFADCRLVSWTREEVSVKIAAATVADASHIPSAMCKMSGSLLSHSVTGNLTWHLSMTAMEPRGSDTAITERINKKMNPRLFGGTVPHQLTLLKKNSVMIQQKMRILSAHCKACIALEYVNNSRMSSSGDAIPMRRGRNTRCLSAAE